MVLEDLAKKLLEFFIRILLSHDLRRYSMAGGGVCGTMKTPE